MTNRSELEEERRIINAATDGPMWMSNPHGPSEIFQGEGSGSDLMCAEFYRPADAQLFLHARTALPLRNAQVEAALKWADRHAARACGESLRRAIEEAGA